MVVFKIKHEIGSVVIVITTLFLIDRYVILHELEAISKFGKRNEGNDRRYY
jgi:hypothetical protein